MTERHVEVAIVGGGPAGATLAATLARAGVEVLVIERAATWRWRAGGVFASPAAVTALRAVGIDGELLGRVARPIPAMRLETPGGAVARITYGADDDGASAVGFDRSALDPGLLAMARVAGAEVKLGTAVERVDLAKDSRHHSRLGLGGREGRASITARVVVGADGAHSIVGRAAGVARPTRLPARVGLSYHLADPRPAVPVDARMRIVPDGYVGIAPVPGGRVNVGIVLGPSWRRRLAGDGAEATAAVVLGTIPTADDDPVRWQDAQRCDRIAGVAPLGVRVRSRAGPGWLLIGDAAGFLDPFTGEGLHRALVSADLAARAIRASMRGDSGALAAYERSMTRRFATKDAVSWLVQAFLASPTMLEYVARRLSSRGHARATMGLVMGDLVPASRGLDPRFLATLLAP